MTKDTNLQRSAGFLSIIAVIAITFTMPHESFASKNEEYTSSKSVNNNKDLRHQLIVEQNKYKRLKETSLRKKLSEIDSSREFRSTWELMRSHYNSWYEMVQNDETGRMLQQQRDQKLLSAIRGLDANAVSLLLKEGANPNARETVSDSRPGSKLLTAMEILMYRIFPTADGGILKVEPASDTISYSLIIHGADIEGVTSNYSMLAFACNFHLHQTTHLLLDLGIDPNQMRNSDASVPLIGADPKTTALLLDHGADPNIKDHLHEDTALHSASAGGRPVLETCRLLS